MFETKWGINGNRLITAVLVRLLHCYCFFDHNTHGESKYNHAIDKTVFLNKQCRYMCNNR